MDHTVRRDPNAVLPIGFPRHDLHDLARRTRMLGHDTEDGAASVVDVDSRDVRRWQTGEYDRARAVPVDSDDVAHQRSLHAADIDEEPPETSALLST
ncbi:MAG: hypothetical protein ACRCXL_07005 [Dermatophilaceae bacterium]